MEYEIVLRRLEDKTVVVDAESEGEAWEKAKKMFRRGKDSYVYVVHTSAGRPSTNAVRRSLSRS